MMTYTLDPGWQSPPRTVTILLVVGPYNFGEVTLQGLIASLRPTFEARPHITHCWSLEWRWSVPCRDSGHPIWVHRSESVYDDMLKGMTRERFVDYYVYRILFTMLSHELDESIVVDGKYFRNPHPEG